MVVTCRWMLDTCECILHQRYDSADYSGTMQIVGIERTCQAHAGLPLPEVATQALAQNRRKNQVLGYVQAQHPGVGWVFRGSVLTLTGIPADQHAGLQAWADDQFGSGSVVVG